MALSFCKLMSIKKDLNSYAKYSNLSERESIGMLVEVIDVVERFSVLVLFDIDEYVLYRL